MKFSIRYRSIERIYRLHMLIYPDVEKVTYGYNDVNGQGFCCDDGTPESAQARAMARTMARSLSTMKNL